MKSTPIYLFLFLALFASSCRHLGKNAKDLGISSEIVGLAQPIVLPENGNLEVITGDIFNAIEKIDSVTAEGATANLSADKKSISIKNGSTLGLLKVYVKGYDLPHSILLKKQIIPQGDEIQMNTPRLVTLNAENDKIFFKAVNGTPKVYALWENYALKTEQTQSGEFSITLPKSCTNVKRSFVRIYGSNGTTFTNDILIPLENGRVFFDTKNLTRNDLEAQIMYFPLLDRFNNGNPSNDAPVNNPNLGTKQNWQGGDIKGITQKIKDGYFKSMNINSLWLSPITKNPADAWQEFVKPNRWYSGYHGYWPVTSTDIDSHFGTEAELKELIATAHENGINVILDYVCHHVHQTHHAFQEHPDWKTVLDLPDGRKNIRIWDGDTRTTTWFDTFLPTLDLSKPDAIEMQSDSAMFWIEKYGMDGFRHDATKHVPTIFWRTLTKKLKEKIMIPQGRKIHQIGETYGGDDLISSYIGTGLLDSQFDFNLFFTARDAFADKGTSDLRNVARAMQRTFAWYGSHSTMGYISGNHDQPRFMAYASGALSPSEDDREAGWNRNIQVVDTLGYKKLHQHLAFTFSIPGIPIIYYGDEIGDVGANDPDNRRFMRFTGWNKFEAETKAVTEKITALRAANIALSYGDTEILHVTEKTLVFARFYFGKKVIIIINHDNAPTKFDLTLPDYLQGAYKANFNSNTVVNGNKLTVDIAPLGFEMLTL